jgi:uncharacterized phiE125 gp8 family phage protein
LTGDTLKVWFKSDSVSSDPDEQYLQNCIKVARQFCEHVQGRSYITQTWDLVLDDFPDDEHVELPMPPLISVTSITYKDTAGASQTMSASDYVVDTYSEPGRVCLAYGATWPSTYDEVNCITIRYVAGYGAASSVPEDTKQAILLMIAHYYENREPAPAVATSEIPMGAKFLLYLRRVLQL